MPFTIATWNVNSLKVRLPHVLDWLHTHQPDVLALQEIKMLADVFPYEEIKSAGYESIVSGQKTYNGVAILTRHPATDVIIDIPQLEDTQRRMLGATIGDVRIINLYVPNGESILSEKYHYKLNWLEHLRRFLQQELTKHPNLVLLGDFNIAPEAIDVHDPLVWEGKVLFSEKERAAFQAILKAGLMDCFRNKMPTEKCFSWWDYRMNAFKRKMGLRIDHILVSPTMMNCCSRCEIDSFPRGLERPSDHAPVLATFSVSAITSKSI